MSVIYQLISTAFCVIVVLANIISAKMVQLPFFGDLSIPAGAIIYPVTFLLSSFVTEIFGAQKARLMVYMAFGMSLLSMGLIQVALALPARTMDEQYAFQGIMGLSGLRIFSSLTAYLVAQILEVQLFVLIRRHISFLWLRSNGSAFAAQLVDTVIVDLIFLYWGMGMGMNQVLPIMVFSYLYKVFFSVANTPLLYFSVFLFRQRKVFRFSEKSPSPEKS